ncbi:DNA polymerase III subunit epsilon [Verticiella sediminum]|uniref:DNA polymerase III subunit epsilon n=1 Tax=Verticiella sediminum TaxID=1247510 RepID=A0A556ABV6_9BURK|nr:DNA polymerase III subunit epsilon [Verticiella sediminum]TSH90374.1 DNA polymerase III subunit epsilon [Verticiella sediminum]
MRHIVLDTETTGLEPELGHRVIEIGCVEIVNRQLTGRHFHTYLNPDRDIDAGAQAVHGLSREFLSGHPRFEDKVDEFLDFIEGGHILIHNATFDVKFLNAELGRLQRPGFKELCAGVIDTLLQARELHPGKRNSLDALCDRYGISNAHRTLHGALLDSELLAEVWLAMTRGQNSLVIDVPDNVGAAANAGGIADLAGVVLPVLAATPEEVHAHETYLDGLDKEAKGASVWRKLAAVPEAA